MEKVDGLRNQIVQTLSIAQEWRYQTPVFFGDTYNTKILHLCYYYCYLAKKQAEPRGLKPFCWKFVVLHLFFAAMCLFGDITGAVRGR